MPSAKFAPFGDSTAVLRTAWGDRTPQESEDPDSCPECSGTGWALSGPGGGAGSASRCACQLPNLKSRFLAEAGIPERYRRCQLSRFLTSGKHPQENAQLVGALRATQTYVDTFDEDGRFNHTGLLFMGPPGTGKTHLAIGVLVQLIERYAIRGRFVEFGSLLYQIQATFDPGSAESKHEILDPLIDAELLVLDELGAQKSTPFVQETLYYVINQRYVRRRPTLFTTNYRLATESGRVDETSLLSTRVSPQLLSRLYEMTRPIDLSAISDFRVTIRSHPDGKQ
jgi:DNA replication protein DnaC